MNLEEAIKRLKPFINDCDNNCPSETCEGCYICYYEVQAIKTIIEALDEKYTKGYQDGFKQAKFDCEMDKLPSERIIKIKDEYLQLIDFLLVDYDGCNTVESLKELIDEARDYIHKALKNDDKSAIYSAGNGKSSNILGEVIE